MAFNLQVTSWSKMAAGTPASKSIASVLTVGASEGKQKSIKCYPTSTITESYSKFYIIILCIRLGHMASPNCKLILECSLFQDTLSLEIECVFELSNKGEVISVGN